MLEKLFHGGALFDTLSNLVYMEHDKLINRDEMDGERPSDQTTANPL